MTVHRWLLPATIAIGFLLRIVFYTGLSVGDDVFYQLQAIAHALDGIWPPEPYHWQTRLAMTLPTAALIRVAGVDHWPMVALPLVTSTAGIYVTYRIALEVVDQRAALLAAAFQACYPLELIYATHLFPDVPVGLLTTLSLWFWIRGLRHDRPVDYLVAGLWFGLGYMCRETIVMSWPAFIGLWLFYGRWRRPALALSVVLPLLVIGGEALLYWATTGNPLYRLDSMAAQMRNPPTLELLGRVMAGGGFWSDPLYMLATNQEFGAFQVAMVAALVAAWRRHPSLRPLAIWWAAMFVWTYYGTTVPNDYLTLQRDPRYASALTAPTVIVMAQMVTALPWRPRMLAAAGLAATGLAGAILDQGATLIEPHRLFAQSRYAAEAVLEPLEYYGVRWHSGLASPAPYKCATDLGRSSVLRLLTHLPATECAESVKTRYAVFAIERREDLQPQLLAAGWKEVARFQAPASIGRRLMAFMLGPLPGQRERAGRIGSVPSLRVYENPARSY